jgi:hypothetical protein
MTDTTSRKPSLEGSCFTIYADLLDNATPDEAYERRISVEAWDHDRDGRSQVRDGRDGQYVVVTLAEYTFDQLAHVEGTRTLSPANARLLAADLLAAADYAERVTP